MKNTILGFIAGIFVCLTCSFSYKQCFTKMEVIKKGCNQCEFSDCETDYYNIQIINSNEKETSFKFVNNYGRTVIVKLK